MFALQIVAPSILPFFARDYNIKISNRKIILSDCQNTMTAASGLPRLLRSLSSISLTARGSPRRFAPREDGGSILSNRKNA